jgi:hypothetical protein
MGGGSPACLFHHFPPEISITLNRWLVSGTSQGRRNRDSVSDIGSTNWKWNLGITSGFLTLRKERRRDMKCTLRTACSSHSSIPAGSKLVMASFPVSLVGEKANMAS